MRKHRNKSQILTTQKKISALNMLSSVLHLKEKKPQSKTQNSKSV